MQMPLNPCDGLENCVQEETSIRLLRSVFGSTIDHLISGEDPAAAGQTEILPAMLGYFNGGLAIVGGLLLLGIMTIGVANSANDGEVFGKNWNPTWTVARMVTGMGMLLPTTAGFSFAQIFVLMIALWGVGLANGVYKVGIQAGILAPESVVHGLNHPGSFYGMRSFAQKYTLAAYCARAANEVYGSHGEADHIPEVGIDLNARDSNVSLGKESYDVFAFKDRSKGSILAGGEPICGEVRIANQPAALDSKDASNSAALAQTMSQIRSQAYTAKLAALKNLMGQIDAWVATWPSDAEQDGWDKVKSQRFNDIVRNADAQVVNALRSAGQGGDEAVTGVMEQLVQDITQSGWSEAGNWFQKVGQVRTSLINVTAAPIASIEMSDQDVTGESDARQELFDQSVSLATTTLNRAFVADGENVNDNAVRPVKFDNLFDNISITRGKKPDVTGFKSRIENKFNSVSNQWIKEVTEIATGANGGGTGEMAQNARNYEQTLCGETPAYGGAINRMKCVGDVVAAARLGLYVADGALKSTVFGVRILLGAGSGIPIVGSPLKEAGKALWDWVIALPVYHIAQIGSYMDPVAFMFGVVLPSMPYVIFIIVVIGWLLGVLMTIVAIPLWALVHMTPEQTFVGSQRQGYIMILSLFVRPALAVIGLFMAVIICDPVVTFVVNGFFAIRGSIDGGSNGYASYIAALPQFLYWMIALSVLLIPVLQMCFALPQSLGGKALEFIGGGVSDLGESGAMSSVRGALAANNAPRNDLHSQQSKKAADRSQQLQQQRDQAKRDQSLINAIKGGGSSESKAILGSQGIGPNNSGK